MTGNKFLGIDFGTKRIGLAVSDERGTMAFPKEIIENGPAAADTVKKLIKKEEIGGIVVGESLDFKGKPNRVAEDVQAFVEKLENLGLPIIMEKEFLTSAEARKSLGLAKPYKLGSNDRVDASAAALILQRYLDRANQTKKDYR